MMRKFEFDYDFDNDSLFIYDSSSKSKASVEIDNLVIDYNSKQQVSSIELFKASDFFKDFSLDGLNISKSLLSDITDCKLDFVPKGSFFLIKIFFKVGSGDEVYAPLVIPSIEDPSPALSI